MSVAEDIKKLEKYDEELHLIVDYVYDFKVDSTLALLNAKAALIDAIGCAFESLTESKECANLVLSSWAGICPGGARIPGVSGQFDIPRAAFCLGLMIRYLDHNDAFPGAEWGHPSDNIGAVLTLADALDRSQQQKQVPISERVTLYQTLTAIIKAYEIQGCFQVKNAFNKVGLDHTILVKVASTTASCWLLGLSKEKALSALSHAWIDGHPLRTFRQFPNTGPRKGWAGGDACMRAIHLSLLCASGDQPGAPTALTQPKWGFYDTLFRGQKFQLPRPFGTWVMENIIFKINTAEGHGLSAVEAALEVSEQLRRRGALPELDVSHISVRTQEAAMVIIDKSGPLRNPADRDHCMQYMVAVVLLKGAMIETADYQDSSSWATDPRVDALRSKISMVEDKQMTASYHDPESRSVANGITVSLRDGTKLPEALVEYPLGHPKRAETRTAVLAKARRNLAHRLPPEQVSVVTQLMEDGTEGWKQKPVSEFMDVLLPQ